MNKIILLFSFILFTSPLFAQIEIFSKQTSLGSNVNSPYYESNVVISPDGKRVFFTRKNHPQNVGGKDDEGDVWVSEMTSSGGWTDAVNLGESLNDKSANRILGFMDHGKAMLLHSPKGISFAYNYNGKWLKPTEIEIPYFKNKSNHVSGCISSDGRYLLFGMESHGTYGVEDLYMCKLKGDGDWTSPKNLGAMVNSPFQEMTPFLAADNKTMFFASNGRGGEGSFDIFMAQRLDDTWLNWTEPVNLGSKVNTKGQELSFVFREEAEYAYLVSTQNSDGYGDLKRVKIKPDIVPEVVIEDTVLIVEEKVIPGLIKFSGVILDKKTKKAVEGARVEFVSDPEGIVYNAISDNTGRFDVQLKESLGFETKIQSSEYLSLKQLVTIEDVKDDVTDEFLLEPLTKGNTIELQHVLFEQGKPVLVQGSERELDLVVEMMKEHQDINIFLAGHTDNQGKAALNLKLSYDRVETVKKYLVLNGIQEGRISGQGYGGTKPIASNDNVISRRRNRRVEFTIQ
ncbi:OmpA family protein [Reichenbachiella sp. MALMAid0571]|uniref:OmpA family protein n=1 Tax=Reichenbachiella sp. MALMAid0571 TaxID=3143939 RepID=UPI0032DF222E